MAEFRVIRAVSPKVVLCGGRARDTLPCSAGSERRRWRSPQGIAVLAVYSASRSNQACLDQTAEDLRQDGSFHFGPRLADG